MTDLRGVPKKSIQKKPTQWDYRFKSSPATFVGIVYAPDEKAALKGAIKEFAITPWSIEGSKPRALMRLEKRRTLS